MSIVAQRPFPLVQFSRPLRFPGVQRPGCACPADFEYGTCCVGVQQMPVVQNAENCEGPAVAAHSDLVGFFAVKCGIFRAPSVRTDVERQFSEPSMVKSSSPSRAPAQ